jgi:hypothetical protein
LLDISNNEEYIWTTIFDPSIPKTPPSSPPPKNILVGAILGSLLSGILLTIGSFFIYKWNKSRQKQKTIHGNENHDDCNQEEKELPIERDIHNNEATNNNNEQEIIQISRNENTINHEPIIIPPPVTSNNNYHKQEIILAPEGENTTNHELIPANDHHGQEIIQTLQNENSTNHEPKTPASAIVNSSNYNYEQETISTANNNRLSSQILKDDILQAVKQEIGQNLKNVIFQAVKQEIGQNFKNEFLQAVKEENFNNAKNNTRQD